MRLWSLHPQYLDGRGLVALWREALLARKVLEGKTKGYQHHPQLLRFKACPQPLWALESYLADIFQEAGQRNYNFKKAKLKDLKPLKNIMPVTRGQVEFEIQHLAKKLRERDLGSYLFLIKQAKEEIKLNQVFYLTEGRVEKWEKAILNPKA